jgi:predicted NBD/HSP70 family sugar kinase
VTTTPTTAARPDDLRRHNRALVLRRLHVGGPSTRAALAAETGLNRSTIKALVDDLAENGVVAERVPTRRTGAGRPSLLVLPQPNAVVVLAVDIRVDQVAMALVGLGGQILGRCSWGLRAETRVPRETLTKIVDNSALLIEEAGVEVAAVGASAPGVVRRADGLVHEAPNLQWTDVPLGTWLSKALDLPAYVANDAELGALAEHLRGAARGVDDVVYIGADVGVGGGVISSNAPLRGTDGYVGEIGHMVVRPDGKPCYCGSQGCWETEVGEAALIRALDLPDDAPRGVIAAELHQLASHPTELMERLGEFAQWLAIGLCNLVNLLCPRLVVLGDLFTELPPELIEHVTDLVRKRSMVSRALGGVRIVTSSLRNDVKLLGAAELAFEQVLATR